MERPEVTATGRANSPDISDGTGTSAVRKDRPKAGPLPPSPCPRCGKIVEVKRSTKLSCPHCMASLHVLVNPETKERQLLDDEGEKKLNARKAELHVINTGARLFRQYGIDKVAIEAEYAKLRKDGRPWTYADAVWSLSNRLVLENIGDLHLLKMIYYGQAIFLESQGKDPSPLIRLSNDMDLQMERKRFREVKISAVGGCEACRSSHGKVFSIEEALETHPIPNPGCTYRFEEGHPPFCRCRYQPVLDSMISRLDRDGTR
ncbi:hypothetical protein [Methanomassiliicoccus luminyensis]|uniref:hypothetical protein n=1 Tax=Methanomassiliicoccus luminyensis TaxID=1080712 RepID=UPI00373AF07D